MRSTRTDIHAGEGTSRRTFLKRGAGVAALAASAPILEACATPSAAPTPGVQSPKAVKGGNLIEAPTFEVTTLNPLLLSQPSGIETTILDGLLTFDGDGSLQPLLAEKLPTVSADGLTYTFELRKDMKWTDGNPITAEDVVFTYKLMYHPDYLAYPSPFRATLKEIIADVRATGPSTVAIKTSAVNASFLAFHSRYGVLPKHVLGSVPVAALKDHPFNKAPTVTSGPFKFKEWISGDHATVVRNEQSYRGVPNVDGYVFKFFPQQPGIVTALQTSTIDMASINNAGVFEEMKAAPHLVARITVPARHAPSCPRVGYNLDPAAPVSRIFSSKVVRQALLYAANREGASKATLFGYGAAPSATGLFGPTSWANNPDAKPTYAYDKAKAEAMLDAEGWRKGPSGIREKNGIPMKWELLTSATNNTWVQIATIFKQNWKDIGVDVNVRPIQYPQLVTASLNREFEMLNFSPLNVFTGADPDPSAALHSRGAVKNGGNYTNYKNPELDKLLDQGVTTFDQAKRKEIYFKIQDIINEDVPYWSTFFWQEAWIMNKRVQSAGPHVFGSFSNRAYMNEFFVSDGK